MGNGKQYGKQREWACCPKGCMVGDKPSWVYLDRIQAGEDSAMCTVCHCLWPKWAQGKARKLQEEKQQRKDAAVAGKPG